MSKVGIIGAGLIGRSWASIFARAGWTVAVWDPSDAQRKSVLDLIGAQLAEMGASGLIDDPKAAVARVRVASSLSDAVSDVDFVQESGPELADIKTKVFQELDAAAPEGVVLASSTSAIVASLFTEHLKGRGRCLVGHPVNPPHLVPVVEICGAPWTTAAAIARARAVYAEIGQVPVTVKKEIEGFILNRLQGALLSEAFRLVQEGYVTPQDLDRTVADGLGLRWSFMGPFETIELNAPEGIADYCKRYAAFYQRVLAKPPAPSIWDEGQTMGVAAAWGAAPSAGRVARKSAWRDRRLARLVAHKRKELGFE